MWENLHEHFVLVPVLVLVGITRNYYELVGITRNY